MTASLLLALALAGPAAATDLVELRLALLSELRALGGDQLGWQASDLLLASSVTLRVGSTPPGPDGRPATAAYATGKAEITLDESLAREKDATAVARRIAPTVLHELEHARADLAAPGAPVVLEGEWAAYAAQALFVRRRLAADPAYLDKERNLGKLRANYQFLAKPRDLDALREACADEGIFKGLPEIKDACPKLEGAAAKACWAAAAYYKARLAELGAELKP